MVVDWDEESDSEVKNIKILHTSKLNRTHNLKKQMFSMFCTFPEPQGRNMYQKSKLINWTWWLIGTRNPTLRSNMLESSGPRSLTENIN